MGISKEQIKNIIGYLCEGSLVITKKKTNEYSTIKHNPVRYKIEFDLFGDEANKAFEELLNSFYDEYEKIVKEIRNER